MDFQALLLVGAFEVFFIDLASDTEHRVVVFAAENLPGYLSLLLRELLWLGLRDLGTLGSGRRTTRCTSCRLLLR